MSKAYTSKAQQGRATKQKNRAAWEPLLFAHLEKSSVERVPSARRSLGSRRQVRRPQKTDGASVSPSRVESFAQRETSFDIFQPTLDDSLDTSSVGDIVNLLEFDPCATGCFTSSPHFGDASSAYAQRIDVPVLFVEVDDTTDDAVTVDKIRSGVPDDGHKSLLVHAKKLATNYTVDSTFYGDSVKQRPSAHQLRTKEGSLTDIPSTSEPMGCPESSTASAPKPFPSQKLCPFMTQARDTSIEMSAIATDHELFGVRILFPPDAATEKSVEVRPGTQAGALLEDAQIQHHVDISILDAESLADDPLRDNTVFPSNDIKEVIPASEKMLPQSACTNKLASLKESDDSPPFKGSNIEPLDGRNFPSTSLADATETARVQLSAMQAKQLLSFQSDIFGVSSASSATGSKVFLLDDSAHEIIRQLDQLAATNDEAFEMSHQVDDDSVEASVTGNEIVGLALVDDDCAKDGHLNHVTAADTSSSRNTKGKKVELIGFPFASFDSEVDTFWETFDNSAFPSHDPFDDFVRRRCSPKKDRALAQEVDTSPKKPLRSNIESRTEAYLDKQWKLFDAVDDEDDSLHNGSTVFRSENAQPDGPAYTAATPTEPIGGLRILKVNRISLKDGRSPDSVVSSQYGL